MKPSTDPTLHWSGAKIASALAAATSESSLKRTIQHYLDVQMAQGLLWWCRVNSGSLLVAGRDERRYRVQLAPEGTADILVIQGRGVDVGFRDARGNKGGLTAITPDVFWIETKRTRGKQSEMQAEFQRRVEAEGCRYILAHSLDDVEEALS